MITQPEDHKGIERNIVTLRKAMIEELKRLTVGL